MTIDFQKVADAIEKAPDEIKSLMYSVELGNKLLEISAENGLEEEEPYLRMVDEVGYVLLGLKDSSTFVDSLTQMGISKESAINISEEVNKEIFSKLQHIKSSGIYDTKSTKTRLEIEEKKVVNDKEQQNSSTSSEKIRGVVTPVIQKLQGHVSGEELAKRIGEICKKYNLSNEQQNNLVDICNAVLANQDKKSSILNDIVKSLGISQLITEQIVLDLERRVFEYAFKEADTKMKPQTPITQILETKNQSPEIRPQIIPAVEKGEFAHDNPPEKVSVPQYMPAEPIKPQQTPVTQPVAPPSPPSTPVPPSSPTPAPVTQPTIQTAPATGIVNIERKPVEEPPKRYVLDPYREPLE